MESFDAALACGVLCHYASFSYTPSLQEPILTADVDAAPKHQASGRPACPACSSHDVLAGTFDGRSTGAFHPDNLRFWTLGPVAAPIDRARAPEAPFVAGPFGAGAHACTSCGLAWVHVDPARLRAVREASGRNRG